MDKYSVRLTSITLKNFKNIENGTINFMTNVPYSSNICGIYGQNGSGKTSIIDALELLKTIMIGKQVDKKFVDFIMVDKDYSELKYTFDILDSKGTYSVEYRTKLGKTTSLNNGNSENATEEIIPVISDEILSYSYNGSDTKINKNIIISTETDINTTFVPVSKYKLYFGNDNAIKAKILLYRQLLMYNSRSFVFSGELLNIIRRKSVENFENEFINFHTIIEKLVFYANLNLFVINTSNSGAINLNTLPLSLRFDERNKKSSGQILLNLEDTTEIPEYQYEVINKVFDHMNIVLEQMVPGLRIGINDLGKTVLKNGDEGRIISFKSYKNSKPIPLAYESEGIKKIISVLQLLIAVYNQKSITVVIDKLDSGIFEYLLGELMKIISEKGEGQLIFTSHNLRPLETLDKRFVVFSTTNPSNRYIRLKNVKSNNNLRDFYYRDILLGEQEEEVYAPTNNAEIAMAFREAGEIYRS
jgi:AAA15 family ATPase/GTPase